MRRTLAALMAGVLVGGLGMWLVAVPSAQGEVAPTGYTLEDIYQFIDSNGSTNPTEGGHSLYPSGAPGQGGMHTLRDIMAALREKLPCHGGGGGALPATGQTKCYDAELEIACGSTDWPGQDGFYTVGCSSEGRFSDNADGTVTDHCTGLMWQKETDPGTYTWQQALQYCEGLSLAGHSDWRLPNVRELQSIVDYGRDNPSIDPVFGAVSHWYWSSSTYVFYPGSAWVVYFYDGHVSSGYKGDSGYVRAVRSGR
jgi:hypothetical protein